MKRSRLSSLLLAALFASAGAPALRAAEIDIRPWRGPEGAISVISVKGELEEDDADRFTAILGKARGRGLVVLDGPGGSADAAIAIGTAIRDRGFTTLVQDGGVCASACAIIWLGGASRRMERGARIGFHQIYDRESGRRSPSGNAAVAAYMEKLDLKEVAIDYATSAPPSGMRWLSLADADNYDIPVEVFDRPKPHGAVADLRRKVAASNGGPKETGLNPTREFPPRMGGSRRSAA